MRFIQPLWCALVVLSSSSSVAAEGEDLTILEAVRSALEKSPDLESAREAINFQKGRLEAEGGRFDWTLSSLVGHTHLYTPQILQKTDATQVSLGVEKQFRWGTIVSPSIELTRSDAEGPLAPAVAQNSGSINFRIVQPLLRDLGFSVAAREETEELLYQAQLSDFEHTLARRVYVVAVQYWSARSALDIVEAYQGAKARSDQLLSEMETLVKADARPASDLAQIRATVADWGRYLAEAKLSYRQAKYALGLAMGLTREEIATLSDPSTAFPDASKIVIDPKLTEFARSNRRDAHAAALRVKATARALQGIENATMPELNLQGEIGYSGYDPHDKFHHLFYPVGKNIEGVNGGLSLLLRWPIQNKAAAGALKQALSSHRSAEISAEDLNRQIEINLQSSIVSMETAAEARSLAKEASAQFQTMVDNERKKLKSGLSTLIDVIFSEDRMTNAQVSSVVARSRYATTLLQLRFESGTLMDAYEDRGEVSEASLMTLPQKVAQ